MRNTLTLFGSSDYRLTREGSKVVVCDKIGNKIAEASPANNSANPTLLLTLIEKKLNGLAVAFALQNALNTTVTLEAVKQQRAAPNAYRNDLTLAGINTAPAVTEEVANRPAAFSPRNGG